MTAITTPTGGDYLSPTAQLLARAAADPDRQLVSDRTRTFTSGEFVALVHRLARALRRQGIDDHSRLALLAPVAVESLALRHAAWLLGGATCYCPRPGSPERTAQFVAQLGADALVVFPQTAPSAALDMRTFSVGPVEGIEVDLLAGDPEENGDPIRDESRPDALAVLLSSGGTTGLSKASMRTFAGWADTVRGPADPNRRQLVCTPLAYVAQVHTDQVLLGGGTLVLREHFDAGEVLETIEHERITHLCVVEPWLVELADHPDVSERDLSSLAAISHIGAAAAPSLRRRILHRLGPVLAHPYGASEAGIVCVLAGPEYRLERPDLLDTVGRPLPGVQVFVERTDRTQAATGEPGLVAVRSAGVAAGYVIAPDDSGFRNGKYYTGDVAVLDDAGYLHLRGRAKDARTVGDRTVFPVDVQDALCEHPDVRYAVAVPTQTGFRAAVLLRPDACVESADLRDWLVSRAAVVPDTFLFLDRMPVTEQGKPDRIAITALAHE